MWAMSHHCSQVSALPKAALQRLDTYVKSMKKSQRNTQAVKTNIREEAARSLDSDEIMRRITDVLWNILECL